MEHFQWNMFSVTFSVENFQWNIFYAAPRIRCTVLQGRPITPGQQCVICPRKGGKVEYVNSCIRELFIMFYITRPSSTKGWVEPSQPLANHTLLANDAYCTFPLFPKNYKSSPF